MGRFLKFLGNIQGFAWYPGLALGVFGLFFLAVILYVISMRRTDTDAWSRIPLDS
jgi:hypothetical protein